MNPAAASEKMIRHCSGIQVDTEAFSARRVNEADRALCAFLILWLYRIYDPSRERSRFQPCQVVFIGGCGHPASRHDRRFTHANWMVMPYDAAERT